MYLIINQMVIIKKILHSLGFHWWSEWDKPRTLPNGANQQFRQCLLCKKQQRNIF